MYGNKLISIIIPVYDITPQLLTKCINSLLQQDYKNFEILLIDDGSRDDYAVEYDKIMICDNRIKIFHKSNGGVSSARNLGLEKARGEYISFVDGDDWVESNFLSALVAGLESNNTELSIVGVDYVYNDLTDTKVLVNSSIYDVDLLNKNDLYTKLLYSKNVGGYLWNKLFKKELINRLLDENLHICEDFEFVADYCQNINYAAYIPMKLYHYLQRNNSSFQIPKYSSRSFSLILAREKITEFYRKNSPENVTEMEKSVLKVALNLRARYKINKVNNDIEYSLIKSTIKKYLAKILKSDKVGLFEKTNIIITYFFPNLILRIKTFVVGEKKN